MKTNMRAKIIATYSDGCFCERPGLNPSFSFPAEPRFEFKKEARGYAQIHGIEKLQWSRSDRSAIGILPVACNHRAEQTVRLDWQIVY
mgnify:CR=1 FL=1